MAIHNHKSSPLNEEEAKPSAAEENPAIHECILAAAPLPVGTNTIYPFREFLRDAQSKEEVRLIVAEYLNRLVTQFTVTSAIEMVDTVQDALCGKEPLTRSQLLSFLDSAGSAMRDIVKARIDRWRKQETAAPAGDTAMTRSSTVTTDTMSSTPASGKRRTLANMDLLATQETPGAVNRKLASLELLESRQPEVARWFTLVEFTGATTEELADYFSLSQEVIDKGLDIALAKYHFVDVKADISSAAVVIEKA